VELHEGFKARQRELRELLNQEEARGEQVPRFETLDRDTGSTDACSCEQTISRWANRRDGIGKNRHALNPFRAVREARPRPRSGGEVRSAGIHPSPILRRGTTLRFVCRYRARPAAKFLDCGAGARLHRPELALPPTRRLSAASWRVRVSGVAELERVAHLRETTPRTSQSSSGGASLIAIKKQKASGRVIPSGWERSGIAPSRPGRPQRYRRRVRSAFPCRPMGTPGGE
jgi:hypothetical protein